MRAAPNTGAAPHLDRPRRLVFARRRGRIVRDLNADLPRLGVLRLRHSHHEQAVAIDRLDPRRIDSGAKAQRATESRRTELLPDRLRTLRHAELHLTLNDERVVMDGHIDALLVKAWRQQRGLVAV